MKLNYQPKSSLEKFGQKIYFLLVENFSHTYNVGGMVRDFLLGKKISDIDIATSAKPDEVIKILSENKIRVETQGMRFGTVTATHEDLRVEITTLRRESYALDRYPSVRFVTNPKTDSERRDFTINALYLSPKTDKIFDYHHGQADLNKKLIRFIGNPKKRIEEDPLRIIRALRFTILFKFKIEKRTLEAIKKNIYLLQSLTKSKTETEILKLKNTKQKNILRKVINNPDKLDKYLK